MKTIEKVVINQEQVHLKKDSLGWHVVHPIKNEDGSINWKNLIAGGSWGKLILIIIFVLICLGAIHEVSSVYKIANDCLLNSSTFQFTVNP